MSVFALSPVSFSLSAPGTVPIGDTATVSGTVTGSGLGSYTIAWYRNGTLLDTTSLPTLHYTKTAGDDTLTAILVSHSRNCYDSVAATAIVVRAHTGIAPTSTTISPITLFPNPATGTVHITGLPAQGATITLRDLYGREWQRTTTTGTTTQLPLPGLASGVYLVVVQDAATGQRWVQKLRVE
ncbi:MAG: T9SS C-terminal target domain-containing protein [Chitinophagia bacterium]|nr:T9SS C-terminal target domain-containing protein [Chitinophagia bacterium]